MKATSVITASLALLLALTACQAAPASPTPGEPIPTPTQAQATPAGEVAARVNGQPIAMSAYQAQLQAAMASFAQQPGLDPNSKEGKASLAALRQQVLDWLVDQALIDQAAGQQGIQVTDEQVTAEVERIRSENVGGFADWLKANGFTEESFRAQTRSDLLGAAMRDLVTRDVGGTAEQVHLEQILLADEAQARSLLEQVKQGQAAFEDLAKAHSQDDATRDKGGDLGFLPRGILAESVEQVAFGLQPGQVAGPVQSPFGWHLIKVVERDPAREIPPEMLATLREEAFMRWLEGERAKAKIELLVKE